MSGTPLKVGVPTGWRGWLLDPAHPEQQPGGKYAHCRVAPPGAKDGETFYPFRIVQDDHTIRMTSLRELLPQLRDLGERGMKVTRFKGLGEMDAEELWDTTMDPGTRTLLKVTMADAAAADEMFRVLMGDAVEPRREFIEKHALDVVAVAVGREG